MSFEFQLLLNSHSNLYYRCIFIHNINHDSLRLTWATLLNKIYKSTLLSYFLGWACLCVRIASWNREWPCSGMWLGSSNWRWCEFDTSNWKIRSWLTEASRQVISNFLSLRPINLQQYLFRYMLTVLFIETLHDFYFDICIFKRSITDDLLWNVHRA